MHGADGKLGDTTIPATSARALNAVPRVGLLWVHPLPTDETLPAPRFTEIGTEAIIGRATHCDITLDVAQVSRQHLRVQRNGLVLVAEDLQSRNGSHYQGQRRERFELEPGAVLRLGDAIAIVLAPSPGQSFEFRELAPGFWGGATLSQCLTQLRRVSSSDLPVIVQGPTGCGKEGVAAAVHHFAHRKGKFVAVNCATLPHSLAESLLFGHKRGAFTGAERSEVGYVGAADGGTLFLDEVLELHPAVQAGLLRVLQQREYVPLGETRPVPVDLRIVVASHTRLEQAVRAGRFREDLYARLNGYQLTLPLLRERREDIPFLFRHFLAQGFAGAPPALRARLVERLCLYDWPRNVRELETVARRIAVLHGDARELDLDQLEDVLDSSGSSAPDPDLDAPDSAAPEVGDAERTRRDVVAALAHNSGNVLRAARQLGISRARAYRLIVALGIDVSRYRKRMTRQP